MSEIKFTDEEREQLTDHLRDATKMMDKHPLIDEALRARVQELEGRIAELEALLFAISAGGVEPLREELAAIVPEENQVDQLFDAVLNCPHTITAESVTLCFAKTQIEGNNALAQLYHRLAAYNQEARQREMQLLGEIEALERVALANLKQQEGGA